MESTSDYKPNQKNDNKEEIVPAPNPVSVEVPRFSIDDKDAYAYLEEFGYVVFKDVANKEEIEKGKELAWDYIESVTEGVSRHDLNTWYTNKWPDPYHKGIISGDSVGQSPFLWYCRGLDKVQRIYANIWETKDLATSFDGFCVFRPIEYDKKTTLKKNTWYHLDQNGHHKPEKICVQGFLNFFDSGPDDGGLVVIEKSILHFKSIFQNRPNLSALNDFIMLQTDKTLWKEFQNHPEVKAIKLCAKAGDFICWDSRTIHSGLAPHKPLPLPTDGTTLPLRRLVAYICMTPKSRLTQQKIVERQEIFKLGITTSHWPEESVSSGARRTSSQNFKPPVLNENQKSLIPL